MLMSQVMSIAVLGVVDGVILAQVVVVAWGQYQSAEVVANDEAGAGLSMARLAQVLPHEDESRVVSALQAYARNAIAVEWPAMKGGDLRTMLPYPLVHQLWQAVLAASTRQGSVKVIAVELLQQLENLSDARHARVLLSKSGLPITMGVTLILGQ